MLPGDLLSTLAGRVAHRVSAQKTAGARSDARDESLLVNSVRKNQFFDAVQMPEHRPPFQVPEPEASDSLPTPLAFSRP